MEHSKVKDLFSSLEGKTNDEIASFFRDKGYIGLRDAYDNNPVVSWISNVFNDLTDIIVDEFEYGYMDDEGYEHFFTTPVNIAEFIKEFNSGKYPFLEDRNI